MIYGICSWCTKEIEDLPFVTKEYPPINEQEKYHCRCFVIAHRALLIDVPDEYIKDKVQLDEKTE